MYTRIINDLTLNESLFEYNKTMEFSSIFDKVGIYSKNLQLINEGNRHLYNDVSFNLNEREQLNDMFSYIEYKLLENYLDEASMASLLKWLKDKKDTVKNAAINVSTKVKNTAIKAASKTKDFMKEIAKLPGKVKNAIQFIEKILNKGITKVSEFIKYIAGLLAALGSSIKESIMSFGIFKDNISDNAPKLDSKFDCLLEKDLKSNAVFNYVMQFVFAKCKDKSYKIALNEDVAETEYKDSGTATLDKWALSYKDSWKEKSKNNTLFRLFLSGTNASGERLGFFKVLLISIIGSFIVCTLVPLIASSVFGLAGVGLTILVIACRALWVVKNVARIIINRTLTYKQSFKIDKNGNVKHSRLFDNLTIASLCIAVITPTIFMVFHDEITNWLHSLFEHNTPDPEPLVKETNPEVIETKLIELVLELTLEAKPVETVAHEVVNHAHAATPDPKPVILEVLAGDIEPAKVVEPTDPIPEVKSEAVVAIKTPDVVETPPAHVTVESTKEAVQLVNLAVGNTVLGNLNQYNITNIDNSVTNVYNETAKRMGGVPRGVVFIHDHHHPHGFREAVGRGRIIVTRGPVHAVQMPHHGPGHPHGAHFGRPGVISDHGTPFKPGSAAVRNGGGPRIGGSGHHGPSGGGRPAGGGRPSFGGGRPGGGHGPGGPRR